MDNTSPMFSIKNQAPTQVELNFYACYPRRITTRVKLSLKLWKPSWATTHFQAGLKNLRKTLNTTQSFKKWGPE